MDPSETRQTTPLPKLQLTLALLILCSEPITATVIYPFIPEFIVRTGVIGGDEKKTGYYAGIIESMFFLCECVVALQWGRISDRLGRRPILLIGPLGLTAAMLGFGLSQSFCQMLVSRCAQGVFNGNIGVARTFVTEITDETNIADAYTLINTMWTVGSFIGPALGGILANPASRWPNSPFGHLASFRTHPYFLPCAAAASISLIAFIAALFSLKETRVKRGEGELQPLLGESRDTTSEEDRPENDPISTESPMNKVYSIKELVLETPALRCVLISHEFLSFSNMAYLSLLPLVFSSKPVSLTPYQIGVILATFGLSNTMLQWFVWKPMLKRVGARKMFLRSYALFAGRLLFLMLTRIVAGLYDKNGNRSGEAGARWRVWACIVLQMCSATFSATAWNAASILLVRSAPRPALGAVNGLGQTVASAVRTVAPTIASSLFAISLLMASSWGDPAKYAVDMIMLGVVLVGVWMSRKLPDL